MKIGICMKGTGNPSIDFSNPYAGNPGVGGTIYLEILLAQLLCEDQDFLPVVFSSSPLKLDERIEQVAAEDETQAVALAKRYSIDIFVFVAGHKENRFYEALASHQMTSVAWAHNFLDEETLSSLEKCSSIQRVVFVGRELYDYYIDDGIIAKGACIENMLPAMDRPPSSLNHKNVTYMGALTPEKGFHLLAEIWKEILAEEPKANLYVLGSGRLYDHSRSLGSHQIAEEPYEKRLLSCLTDAAGSLLPSVHFLGVLGKEKYDYLSKTAVGVANPSGRTETFCMAALEMEQMGIPVVSYRGHGILDTVKNRDTGFLIRGKRELKNKILLLLRNDALREAMGKTGRTFSASFDCQIIIRDWKSLFQSIQTGAEPSLAFSQKNYGNDLKWLKWLHFKLFRLFHLRGASVARVQLRVKRLIDRVLRR